MTDLAWKDAIVKVLPKDGSAMRYTDIAEAIVSAELRTSFGATPAATVSSTISQSRTNDADSPFVSLGAGYYALKLPETAETPGGPPAQSEDEAGFINAFGMFWRKGNVDWKSTNPRLFGQQQMGSEPVDFCQQRGVYLLHDGSRVVYVGRTTDQPLGVRLRQHTYDRLNGRWDRFSWFGVLRVQQDGSLTPVLPSTFSVENLIATMEALLIEGLEPPQNRKRGDDFSAAEFMQAEDPEAKKARALRLMAELKKNL